MLSSSDSCAHAGLLLLNTYLLLQHVRDLTDPEHPYTLEQLKVVNEEAITVKDEEGVVRWASGIGFSSFIQGPECMIAAI